MEETKNIKHARSKNNGIVFYSNTFPLIGYEAYLNANGDIETRLISEKLEKNENGIGIVENKNKRFNIIYLIIFDLFLIIASVISCLFFSNFTFVMSSIFFCAFVSVDLFRFINNSYEMKLTNARGESIAKFHAAEHMVINAYEKLQRIPTLEEARTYSRFSKDCGSARVIARIFMFSLDCLYMAFLLNYSNILYLICVLLTILLTIIASKNGGLNIFQIFVTEKPSDEELKLAIAGLEFYEDMEKVIKESEEISIRLKNLQDFLDK